MSTRIQPSLITRKVGAAFLLLTTFASYASAQVAGGNLTGAVLDPKGAAISDAKVEVENLETGIVNTTVAEGLGQYHFDNLLVGNYKVTASAPGFRPGSVTGVAVQLSKTGSANITLQIGAVTDTVTVTEAGSLIDAVSAQISNLFPSSMVSELAVSANPTGGYNNLSLLGAGVASGGGVGVGTGPSVGGARTRDNNFMFEGADNNRKDVTGPVLGIPTDMVAEFSILQNQFSAEFGHASGGQFNSVLRSGTNDFHGRIYEYFQNRYLNAQDEAIKRLQITSERPRYDQNILGGMFGGPIQEDRLFFFGGFDYNPLGRTSPVQRWAPTADGYNTLQLMTTTVSQTNLAILKQYAGAAPVQDQDYTSTIRGVDIPIGLVGTLVPSNQATYRGASSMDFNMTDKDQWRGRYIFNHSSGLDSAAQFPAFWTRRPISAHLASISEVHTFSPTLQSEARLAYTRYDDRRDVPGLSYPGLDSFPSITVRELGLQIGPNVNSPQSVVQNVYQFVENLTWNKGNHSVKVGFDGRDSISRLNVVSGAFGDYQYLLLDRYLADLVPNGNATRSSNIRPYYGNAMAFYLYGNDNWKVSRNLTVNLGLRWEYNGVAKSMKEFAQNSMADVPGVITFFAPTAQKRNFAPRLGFAYSPGRSGRTSIRGGFGMAYDQIFDNIGNNVRPPESSVTTSVPTNSTAKNFLGTGGIAPVSFPTVWTTDVARANTVGWLPNQTLGYAVTWNFGIQQVFGKDYVVDIRYLGTRGVHLLVQTSLNRNAIVTPTHSLPTYLSQPSQAELNALTLTTAQLATEKTALNNPLGAYGFSNSISTGITSYVPQGNSIYHGLAIDVTKRFSGQFMFKTGYTWSHLMDDSTTEVNFTTLSPRRPQNFGDLRSEWASSALDRRQRFTFTTQWDSPWFKHHQNALLRNVLGNYSLSGTYTVESPQYVTPQSVVDANQNGDSASDRVIVNPQGVAGTSSDVSVLKNSAGATVGYLALNPTAQYIKASTGAYANSGRNLLATQGINNFDLSASKFFPIGETRRLEFRADFYNALNHAQYTPGRVNNILATTHAGETVTLQPGNPLFGQFNQLYPSNSRFIQLVAKFSW